MSGPMDAVGPRYHQVAIDIASRIADKQYQVGERIYARSSIASQYAVSSETARRAIAILSDLGIVETAKGSGVLIKSEEKALQFIQRFRQAETLTQLKRSAQRQAESLIKECTSLKETIERLSDRADRLRFINPFTPYETTVEATSGCTGKSLSELNFWHNTGATIIAVRRGGNLILSPGPYEVFASGDVVYFICEESKQDQTRLFIENAV